MKPRVPLMAWRLLPSLRFAAGMTMIGGVFVFVQALLLVEDLWAGAPRMTSRPESTR